MYRPKGRGVVVKQMVIELINLLSGYGMWQTSIRKLQTGSGPEAPILMPPRWAVLGLLGYSVRRGPEAQRRAWHLAWMGSGR